MSRNAETQTILNASRIRYWLSVGAQPSHKVQCLLNKQGVKKPAPGEPWQVARDPSRAHRCRYRCHCRTGGRDSRNGRFVTGNGRRRNVRAALSH